MTNPKTKTYVIELMSLIFPTIIFITFKIMEERENKDSKYFQKTFKQRKYSPF